MSFPIRPPGAVEPVGKLTGPAPSANDREAALPAGHADRIPPSADERTARLVRQFAAYADMLQATKTQAPAVLRQLADVLTLSIASRAASPTAGPDAKR